MEDGSPVASPPSEAWPRMGGQSSNVMQRPNPPPRITLPQASSARPPPLSPSPLHSSEASSTHSRHTRIPCYYSISPPPESEGLHPSSPLARQRATLSNRSSPVGASGVPHFIPTSDELTPGPSPLETTSTTATPVERENIQPEPQHHGHARSDSNDTVKGPLSSATRASEGDRGRANSRSPNQLPTPFQDYPAASIDDRSSTTNSLAATVIRTPSTLRHGDGQKHQPNPEENPTNQSRNRIGRQLVLVLREEDGDLLGTVPRLRTRLTYVSSSIHGMMLGLECIVLLIVGSALVWITVSKKTTSDQNFWTWLWTVGEPLIGVLLLLCFAILVTHEVRPLSTVAHLYLQSGVLMLTTLAAVTLVARCLKQESRAVKGVTTGCCLLMWATAFLVFLRAVVIWKIESMETHQEGERDSGGDGDGSDTEHNALGREVGVIAYGTFTLMDNS